MMSDFIADEEIQEQFVYFRNMCELLNDHKRSTFAPPADLQELEAWEREQGVTLPDRYKSRLMLTSSARLLGGYAELTF